MHVRVDNLSFTYGNAIQALRDITLEISKGEHVALIGHNGSGKSTLVQLLNGLLKPSAGKVWIGDSDTSIVPAADLAHKVALLFQNPDNQICKRTVWDEVEFGPKNLGYSDQTCESLVKDALELFELTAFKHDNPLDFGYSERKRIAMASIVAMDTPVLVLDEPTAGLDPYEISLLIAALNKVKSANKTVIVISHDMDFVAENFTRATTLDNGRKVFDGSVHNLFKKQELMNNCGMQQPQVMKLCNALAMNCVALTPSECVAELKAYYNLIF